MNKFTFTLSIILFASLCFGQNPLVGQGVELHNQGKYEEAIQKFDEALKADSNSILAHGEKAYSQYALKQYEAAIASCKKAININPTDELLKFVYTTYANCEDKKGNSKEALKVYDEGIITFPKYYHLYFNKGITMTQLKRNDEALDLFEKSAILKPTHASSHNAIGRTLLIQENKIPALLALGRFMTLEPKGRRAELNLPYIQGIVSGNVTKTGKNAITINIDAGLLPDSTESEKENDFSMTELILSFSAALEMDKKKKTDVQRFASQMETICSSMEETQKDNSGFYWEYYAPYFIEMQEKKLLDTFCYMVFASTDTKDVKKWFKKNQLEVTKFLNWSAKYEW